MENKETQNPRQISWRLLNQNTTLHIYGTDLERNLVNAVLYRKDIEEIKSLLNQGAHPEVNIGIEYKNFKGELIKIENGSLLYHLVTQEPEKLVFKSSPISVANRDEQKRLERREKSQHEEKQRKINIETSNKIIEISDLLLRNCCDVELSTLAQEKRSHYTNVDQFLIKAYEIHKIVKQQMHDAGYRYTKDNHKELDKLLAIKRAKYIKQDCSIDEIKDLVKNDPDLSVEPITL